MLVWPRTYERCILNRVCPSRSLKGPSEPLPVVCLELHEPQVVLSALPVFSPLPQRVCWHQHPQWLLSALEHSAVTTQDFWTHSLCLASSPERVKGQNEWRTLSEDPEDKWNRLCIVRENPLSWLLPCILNLLLSLFILRRRFVSGFTVRCTPVVCRPPWWLFIFSLPSHSAQSFCTTLLLMNNQKKKKTQWRELHHFTVYHLQLCSSPLGVTFLTLNAMFSKPGLTPQPTSMYSASFFF